MCTYCGYIHANFLLQFIAKKIRIKDFNGLKYKGKAILEIINSHWTELAEELNIPLEGIYNETATSMRGKKLIKEWIRLSKEDEWIRLSKKDATWGNLINALKSIGQEGMAQSLEKKLK